MDALLLPEELELAFDRFERDDTRIVKTEGHGASAHSLAVIQRIIDKFAADVATRIASPDKRYYADRELLAVIRTELDPNVLAVSMLQSMLHGISLGRDYRKTSLYCGWGIEGEVWAAGLAKVTENRKRRDGTEYTANLQKDIETFVRRKHGNAKYRRRAARAIVGKRGYSIVEWDQEQRLRVGHWALTAMLELLPNVFMLQDGPRGIKLPVLTPEADAAAHDWIGEMIVRKPVWLPRAEAPLPWTDVTHGGVADPRLARAVTLVRASHARAARRGAASQAIHDGTMRPLVDAVNALQAVPWTINKRVLGVMHEAMARGHKIEGLPPALTERPDSPENWDELSDVERRRYKRRVEDTERANRRLKADKTRFLSALKSADALSELDQFWTAMNVDWRGRVYPLPSFNYQREGTVRSLMLFAHGEPINDEGMYWLKSHIAGVGEFEGVHKKPFSERVQWTDDNLEMIRATAEVPLADHRWHDAKEPWLFLAACQQFVTCMDAPLSTRTVSLPVAYDATASGLQHLCAMTRAPEGALVNLTPSALPRDVYQVVADHLVRRLESDLTNEENRQLARICLDYINSPGVQRRDIVKRNVMTYAYSSKVYGMAEQQREDLMDPLKLDVLLGKIPEHPFGPDDGYSAAKYLARHTYAAIEEVVQLPAQAMAFLQKLAKALAHESKPLRWMTPAGLPWINAYHVPITKRVTLWLADKGARVLHQVKLTTGEQREIDKDKAAQGVAPNFVHALDASHLLRTVVAAANEGITSLATVHDSFGCLPNHAGRFRHLIREEFVRMYEEHDVLTEIYEQAFNDIDDKHRVMSIEKPMRSTADIREVLRSDFAFA